jgi:flagellar hook-associated protein 1 FlgK
MDINSISSTAYQGLQMAQAGMLVTSQNVSGASVDGYSRRNANGVIDAMAPNAMNLNGTAFAVNGFIRQYNSLVSGQLLNQQAKSSYSDTLVQYTSTINSLVANTSTGLQTSIAKFFNAMGTYASNPTSTAAQSGLTGSANEVSASMAGIVSMVGQLSSNAQSGLSDSVNQVNSLLPQLATVNQQIINSQVGGNNTGASPDLLDQRDKILGQLQTLVGGQSLINNDGTATQIIGGINLVERGVANQLKVNNPGSPSPTLSVNLSNGSQVMQIKSPATGSIGALMTLITNFVPSLNQRLDTIAQSLVSIANNVSGASSSSGGALKIFGFNTSNGILGNTISSTDPTSQIPQITSDLAINALYKANGGTANLTATQTFGGIQMTLGSPNIIISSDNVQNGQGISGTGIPNGATVQSFTQNSNGTTSITLSTNATATNSSASVTITSSAIPTNLVSLGLTAANFAALAPTDNSQYVNAGTGVPYISSTNANAASQYSSVMGNAVANLVSDVGVPVATWTNNQTANQAVLSNLKSQQSAVSGVNLDEEAANLLKFQQMYQASSKVLQAGNQMFQSILAIMN